MLIPLTLAAAFSLVACGGESNDSSTSSPEESSSSSSSSQAAVVDVTVDQATVSVEVNKFVSVTATVTGTTNKNVTWSSADETIATVEAGVITGKKIGTTTVTVTSDADNTKKATIAVTVTAETVDSTKTTISALLEGTGIVEKTVYEVEGILEGLSHTDQYGNAYLSDPTTGKSVKIYGMTATSTALTVDNGEATFKNPKDAKTSLADVENGEKIKVLAVYTSWSKNISCVLTSHVADDSKYTASFEANDQATISLDKTSDLKYGDTVTVTVTPTTGYVVDAVNVKTLYGSISATASSEAGKYTFAATCSNEVVVTVSDPNVKAIDLDLSAGADLDNFANMGTSYGSFDATIKGVKLAGTRINANKPGSLKKNILVMAANGNDVSTLVISGKNFTSLSFNFYWWGTKDTTKLAIESSDDGENWTKLSELAQPDGVSYGTETTSFATGEDFTGSKFFRLTVTTSLSKNQRIAISSMSFKLA